MKDRSLEGLDLFLDALAAYLREHPDAGPSAVMKDLPEINFRAAEGRAMVLYEHAVRRAVEKGSEEPFRLKRVKDQIALAHKMVGFKEKV